MQKKKIIAIVLSLLIIALLVFIVQKIKHTSPTIDSFEECAGAGNPVMESYPMRCRTPDGQEFVQDISQIPDVPTTTIATTTLDTAVATSSVSATSTPAQ